MTPFPIGGRAIIEQMMAKFPELAVNDDALQRQLTQKINQQFAFTYGPRWGGKKRAGLVDEHQSKDSQAVQEADGTTSVWDMFSASVAVLVNDGDLPIPVTHAHLPPSEATFMPCAPINHLGVPDPGRTEPDPGTPDLAARLKAIDAELALIRISLAKLHEKPAPVIVFPDYTGRLFGYAITLKPKA